MSAYVHASKAGNIGDVWKHFFLYELWNGYLVQQNVSLYLETHAGAGWYQLHDGNREQWGSGIGAILGHPDSKFYRHPLVSKWVKRNRDGYLYPGSAAIARAFVRAEDMHLFEVDRSAAEALRRHFPGAHVYQADAWSCAIPVLKDASGEISRFVFIDPPFRDDRDWHRLTEFVNIVLAIDASTVIAGWYPVFSRKEAARPFYDMERLKQPWVSIDCVVLAEPPESGRLIGSGMFAVNIRDERIIDRLRNLSAGLKEELAMHQR
ncbi:MAG: hypothetical protein BAA02_04600 [Paenibacillaceae bacterium ZCTH02-B3]|nr:MAG: hypothetical protein BAA02_04600 [Paenibacillaceae bacterium ZCTH02-B3]